ncbi:telomere recombination family protein, partial [Chlamydia psittaci 08DC60]
IEIRENLWLCM